MDYSLLRTIENPPFYIFPRQRRFNLPSNPHIDYINPGIGFVTKAYDFYVPLFAKNFQYPIEKKDEALEDIDLQKGVESGEKQEGKGLANDIDVETNVDDSEKLEAEKDKNSENTIHKNKKRLSEGVFEAFMHPKIKSAKLVFPKKQSHKLPTGTAKKTSHSFNII